MTNSVSYSVNAHTQLKCEHSMNVMQAEECTAVTQQRSTRSEWDHTTTRTLSRPRPPTSGTRPRHNKHRLSAFQLIVVLPVDGEEGRGGPGGGEVEGLSPLREIISMIFNHFTPTVAIWASECPDVKNYKWRLNPVWHRMFYSCTHMATVGVKGLMIQLIMPLPHSFTCVLWVCLYCTPL